MAHLPAGVVVGHSQTGEMDKIDGPYYFFKLIQRLGDSVPAWLPLVAPELGDTNVVPVDYVVAAMDRIAHQPGLDGRAFHLAEPASAALLRGRQRVRAGGRRATDRGAARRRARRSA